MTLTVEKTGRRWYFLGNTYSIKDQLKQEGCKWDPERKAWWTGKQGVADKFSGDIQPTEKSEDQKREELSSKDCFGKVKYKGKLYYVIGRSGSGKLHLTVLDCSIDFWATEDSCVWEKRYAAKSHWGGYGRGQVEQYQSVASIRRFIDRTKSESTAERESREDRAHAYREYGGVCRCDKPVHEGDGSCVFCGYGIVQ